ncbi:MAG: 4Fe-4S binding protein [Lachnospiraceae bacterium]|nr:4Fe-4S binding protein [Lachnospiraceae bacterium]
MIRRIITIDENKCNGCGLCAEACHEGAIGIVNGKAKLLREDYCDGLGDCLPACPMNAISFEEREAPAYNEEAVLKAKQEKQAQAANQEAGTQERNAPAAGLQRSGQQGTVGSGKASGPIPGHQGCHCPGSAARAVARPNVREIRPETAAEAVSELRQWPVQIKLVPVNAPYFDGANLLIAADCTAYAYANFHTKFMRNKITLIGCPKLDSVDYTEKLTQIIAGNDIKSVTVVRMEVPCCGGISNAVKNALQASGKFIPWQIVTISVDGTIIE